MIAAQPLVTQLQPAASNLAAATPNLSKTFNVINHLGNMLGYNPGNTEHGYLWWLAWLDHEVRTLFSIQDANGVFRPMFLQLSCASMTQVANGLSGSAVLLNLTPIMSDPALCPTQSTAGLPTLAKHPASSRSAKTNTPVASSPGASSSTTPSSTGRSASSSTSSGTTTSPNAASSATNAANSALNSILKP